MRVIDKVLATVEDEGVRVPELQVIKAFKKGGVKAVVVTLGVETPRGDVMINYRVVREGDSLQLYKMVIVAFSPGIVYNPQSLLMPKHQQPTQVPLMWDFVDSNVERRVVFESLLRETEEGEESKSLLN